MSRLVVYSLLILSPQYCGADNTSFHALTYDKAPIRVMADEDEESAPKPKPKPRPKMSFRFMDRNGWRLRTPDQRGPTCWAHALSNAAILAAMIKPPPKPAPVVPVNPSIPSLPPMIATSYRMQDESSRYRVSEHDLQALNRVEAEESGGKRMIAMAGKDDEGDEPPPPPKQPSLLKRFSANLIARFRPNAGNDANGTLAYAQQVGWNKHLAMKVLPGDLRKLKEGMEKGVRYAGYFYFEAHAMAIIGVDVKAGTVTCRDSNVNGRIRTVNVNRGGWNVIGVANKEVQEATRWLKKQGAGPRRNMFYSNYYYWQ